MNTFFDGKSSTDKGTLFHLKNVFGHKSVKKDIGETFNYTASFVKFVTYGYTMLAAMKVTGMKNLHDEVTLTEDTDKAQYIDELGQKIVNLLWHELNSAEIMEATTEDGVEYCTCKEGTQYY